MNLPRLLTANDYAGMQKRFEETRERLQRKISRFSGELVVAVSRDYEEFRMNPHGPVTMYDMRSLLEAGIIGKETTFGNLSPPSSLISRLQSAVYQHHGGTFLKRENPEFLGVSPYGIGLLINMDDPPELPLMNLMEDEEDGIVPCIRHGYPQTPMIHETKNSRLELYIGDAMAVPYLRGILEQEQFTSLARELEIVVPQ